MNPGQEPDIPLTKTVRAEGVFFRDDDGARLIDGLSGFGGATAGFGQGALIASATAQMRCWPYDLGQVPASREPCRQLTLALRQAAPRGLEHVSFASDGTAAMNLAVQTVIRYRNATNHPQRKHFIALERSNHGGLGASAGLTGIDRYHKGFDLPNATQHHIPSPYPYRHPLGPDPGTVLAATVQAFHDKVRIIGRDDVAAFVCEPIQCNGGVIVPPAGFLRAMRDACDEHGVMMILDEGATAFRMTGMQFACELDGIVPDILTLGSGLTLGYLPLGAVIVSDRVHQTITDTAPDAGLLERPAHPVSAAVALTAMRLLRGGLLKTSRESAWLFQDGLLGFATHPLVGEVRGRGLLGALELVREKTSKARLNFDAVTAPQLAKIGLRNGLVFKIFADGILGIAPPVCITRGEVDLLVERLGATLDQFHNQWKEG